jgi:hypothetical protein
VAEVHSEEGPIGACGAINISGTHVVVVGQYDGSVRRIIHPPLDGGLGGIICTGPCIDDLPTPATGIPCTHLPFPITGSVRAGMREEIIDRHVQAVNASGNLERIVFHQGRETGIGAFVVDQSDGLCLEGTIIDRRTAGRVGRN